MRILLLLFISVFSLRAEVSSLRVPNGGISPQCQTDAKGTTHMIYYKGSPQSGDIFYTTRKKGSSDFEPSVRVNSLAGSAVAMGTIRAAQMSLGKDNSVHVVWNGSEKAKGLFLYSKSLGEGKFSSQEDMSGLTAHIDGGGSVAANDKGMVYIIWHANKKGTTGEENRRVFVATSNNNGESFEKEKEASPENLGICPCCSLKAFAKGHELTVLFRGAKGANRDVYQILSTDNGKSFKSKNISKWRAQQCPMSSQSVNPGKNGFIKAWESDGKISFASELGKTMSISGKGNRKHPVIVENKSGSFLVAWAEGTGWNKGGDLCWQEISSSGRPLSPIKRIKDGVKVWSTVSAFADGDKFFIVH